MCRIGTIPYKSIGEKINISNRLKSKHAQVRITVFDGYIMYEYKERLDSIFSV